MNIETIYDNETQKLIDKSSAVLSDYSESLSKRLAIKVDSKEITYKQAVEAFHGDIIRNTLIKSCADIIATSIPSYAIEKEI